MQILTTGTPIDQQVREAQPSRIFIKLSAAEIDRMIQSIYSTKMYAITYQSLAAESLWQNVCDQKQ